MLVKERFTSLVNTHFIQRCPSVITNTENANKAVPTLSVNEAFLYEIPQVIISFIWLGFICKLSTCDVIFKFQCVPWLFLVALFFHIQVNLDQLSRKRNASGEAEGEPSKKRQKTDCPGQDSKTIFWRINFDRIRDYLRFDEEIDVSFVDIRLCLPCLIFIWSYSTISWRFSLPWILILEDFPQLLLLARLTVLTLWLLQFGYPFPGESLFSKLY